MITTIRSKQPSEVARKIAGTFIEDDTSPKPPLHAWIQSECRNGVFKTTIEDCAREQPEPLRPDLTVVESLDADKITLRLPCRIVDHESPSPCAVDVLFELNPLTLTVKRL